MDLDITFTDPAALDNIKRAASGNPDAAAEAGQLAPKWGVPEALVRDSVDQWKLRDRIAQGTQLVQEDPKLGEFLANAKAANLSADEWPLLHKFGKALQVFSQVAVPGFALNQRATQGDVQGINDFSEGFQQGNLTAEKGAIGSQMMLGLPADTTKLTQIEQQLKEMENKSGFFRSMGDMFGQLTPSMTPAAAGALATAWTGPGASVGGVTAFAMDQGRRAAGAQYLDLLKMKDANGKAIDPKVAWMAATTYGMVVGGLNFVGGTSVSEATKTGVKALLDQSLKTIMKSPSVNEALVKGSLELGKAGLVGAGIFGAQETAKALSEEVSKMASSPDFATAMNDPKRRQEIVDHVTSSMIQGFALSTMLHMPGIGMNKVADSAWSAQSRRSAMLLDQLMADRDQMKTWARDPNLIEEFSKTMGNPTMGVNAEVALRIRNENPGAFDWIPGFEEAAGMAAAGGGDMKIPMAVYLKNVSPELHQAIKNDVRIGDAPTINEAQALKDNPPPYVEIFHGTPWDFTQFGDEHFGKGEGNQTYGLGHYVTEHPGIAEFYKDSVTTINNTPRFFIEGRQTDPYDARDVAAMEMHFNGGDAAAARQALQRVYDWSVNAGDAERAARYKQAIAELNRPLPPIEVKLNEELYPQVISGKLKAQETEMSDLRKTVAGQNDKTKAAVAQLEKEIGENAAKMAGVKKISEEGMNLFIDRNGTLKDFIKSAEMTLGQERVREVFIENGVKAHKYETTQSMNEGGEFSKGGKFIKPEDMSEGLYDALELIRDRMRRDGLDKPAAMEQVRKELEQRLKDQEDNFRESGQDTSNPAYTPEMRKEDYEHVKGAIQKTMDALDNLKDYEIKPAHNYVVLKGEDIEITHKNGVEIKPLVPPKEILEDKVAAEVFSDTKDLVVQMTHAEAQMNALDALFKDAQAAGMTNVEYALYLRRLSKMQEAINDKAYNVALREAKRRLTPEWKENRKNLREEVEEGLRSQPEIMALRYLRQGEGPDGELFKWKLDKAETERLMGKYAGNRGDYPGELPKGITQKDGMHPEDAAKLFGFDSARELLIALDRAEAERAARDETWGDFYKRTIDEETDRRMEAQYGKLDEAIQAAAKDAVLGAKQLDILSAELNQLAKMTGIENPFSKEAIAKSASDLAEKANSGSFSMKDWQREAGKAGRQAEVALLKGQYDVAFKAKQRQMIALKMQKEARAFEKETKSFDKMIKPFLRDNVVSGVAQEFTDQIQRLLNVAFQQKTFRDMNELNRGNPPNLEDFVNTVRAKHGVQIDIPEFLADPAWQAQADRSVEGLTVEQKRDLHEFLKEMIHAGKETGKIRKGNERIEISKIVGDAQAQAQAFFRQGGKFDPDAWQLQKGSRKAVQWWDSLNIRMERLFSWLDNNDSNGVFNTYIFRPLAKAQEFSLDLSKKIADEFKALAKPDRLDENISHDLFYDSDGKVNLTKENLLVAALNMGNESNWQTFTRGWNVDPQAAERLVFDHLTANDWKFVQGIWDIFERELFPLADQAARDNIGVGLKKIEPRELDTPHGKITGGYYPLVEHPDVLNKRGVETMAEQTNSGWQPYPSRGYTKRRTGMAYPVALELRPLHGRIAEMVHDIAFRGAWDNANKLLKQRELRQIIKEGMGEEYLKRADQWLDHIATRGGETKPLMNPGLTKMSRFLRENMVTMLIGFKPSTALIHGGAALANSIMEVGLKNFIVGVHDSFQRNPQTAMNGWNEAMAESGMLRTRKHNIDRDIARILEEAVGSGKFWRARAAYAQFATSLVANLDLLSAVPTWIAARDYAMSSKGMNRADANYYADQTVRNAHGNNGMIDLPEIMRQGEPLKWMTAFGGFFNHNYNQIRDRTRMAEQGTKQILNGEIKEGFLNYAKFLGGVLGYLVAGSVVHTLVRGSHGASWEEDPAGWLADGIANQLISTQFGLRDVGFWASTGHKGKVAVNSPLNEVLTGLAKPAIEAKEGWHTGKPKPDMVGDLMQAPGWATGIGPSNYLTDMFNYMTNDRARTPTDFWEYWRLAVDAKAPPKNKGKAH